MVKAFSHDELEIKQAFFAKAQEYYLKSLEDESELHDSLTAALMFMNLTDYMCEYLVINLNRMFTEATEKYYLGLISYGVKKDRFFTIENCIQILEGYGFPKKAEILSEIKALKKNRNIIAHQILKTKSEDSDIIDNALKQLAIHTDKLVELIDSISPGLQQLKTILD